MENDISQPVLVPASPSSPSGSDTLTFVTTEGEHIIFEGMDVPVGEATWIMGLEAMTRIWGRVDVHADALRDDLLESGTTL